MIRLVVSGAITPYTYKIDHEKLYMGNSILCFFKGNKISVDIFGIFPRFLKFL